MIHGNLANLQRTPSAEGLFQPQDLTQIVVSSRLWPEPPVWRKPWQKEIVWHKGKRFKLRSYPSAQIAQRKWEYLNEVKGNLFVRCYGRIGRYLVLDYINSNGSGQRWDQILGFLSALAKEQTATSIEDDFDQWCIRMGSAGIFLPRTIELLRRYHRSWLKSLGPTWRLEYYDPLPQNFVTTEAEKLIAIDEKSLEIGPAGVGLSKLMKRMAEKDFLSLKEAYSKNLDFSAIQDPECRDFLHFYRYKRGLYWSSYVAAAMKHNRFSPKRRILKIIRRSLVLSLREKLSWELDYRYYRFPVARQRASIPRILSSLLLKTPKSPLSRPPHVTVGAVDGEAVLGRQNDGAS